MKSDKLEELVADYLARGGIITKGPTVPVVDPAWLDEISCHLIESSDWPGGPEHLPHGWWRDIYGED